MKMSIVIGCSLLLFFFLCKYVNIRNSCLTFHHNFFLHMETLIAIPEPVLRGILLKFGQDEEDDVVKLKSRYSEMCLK
jgi:hypothetical protein